MADKGKSKDAPDDDSAPVNLHPEQYRSMILAKLRSDISAKQALFVEASIADVDGLARMSYWKMGYWKMKYWKMGHMEIVDIVSDPV